MSNANITDWDTYTPATAVGKSYAYIDLPVFSYSSNLAWGGASEIATQFNFSASQNFVLLNRPAKPSGVNYCLTIRYRQGADIKRWKLWENVGEILNVPLYAGQVIKKNFTLEVWTIETSTTVSNAAVLQLISGLVVIPSDLRDTAGTALASGTEVPKSDIDFTPGELSPLAGYVFRYRADNAVYDATNTITSWPASDSNTAFNLTGSSFTADTFVVTDSNINNKPIVRIVSGALLQKTGISAFEIGTIWFVIRQRTFNDTYYIFQTNDLAITQVTPSGSIKAVSGALNATTADIPISGVSGAFYFLKFHMPSNLLIRLTVYDSHGNIIGTADSAGAPITIPGQTSVSIPRTGAGSNAFIDHAEILAYTGQHTTDESNGILNYLTSRYYENVFTPALNTLPSGNAWLDNS